MLRSIQTTSRQSLGTNSTIPSSTTTRLLPLRLNQTIPPRIRSQISTFSTATIRSSKQSSNHGDSKPPPNGNPEMPAFSLQGLGISKNMKMALIVLVSIMGTMETWTYYTWWRNWYYGENKYAEENQQ